MPSDMFDDLPTKEDMLEKRKPKSHSSSKSVYQQGNVQFKNQKAKETMEWKLEQANFDLTQQGKCKGIGDLLVDLNHKKQQVRSPFNYDPKITLDYQQGIKLAQSSARKVYQKEDIACDKMDMKELSQIKSEAIRSKALDNPFMKGVCKSLSQTKENLLHELSTHELNKGISNKNIDAGIEEGFESIKVLKELNNCNRER